jgi:hypothetical protein
MKLSTAQIILGAFIVLAACYVTGWMIHKAPSQLRQPFPNETDVINYIDVIPEHNELFNVARYGSYLLPVAGIFLLVTGAVQNVKTETRNRSLVIADVVAGLLVAALAFIITAWGYPTTFHTALPLSSTLTGLIYTNPGRTLVAVQSVSGAMLLLGLAVFGVNIAQLVKSWKTTN